MQRPYRNYFDSNDKVSRNVFLDKTVENCQAFPK